MKLNKKLFINTIILIIFGAGFVFIGYHLSLKEETLQKFLPGHSVLKNVIFFSSIIIGPYFAIVLHELGHLLAGIFQGFKVELYVVGFLGIKRVDNSIKWYFNTDWEFFGGMAATSPRKFLSDDELINTYKIILISGPLASLAFGIIPLLIFFNSHSILDPFFALLGVTSLGLCLATTLPNKSGIFFTDRKRYQRLNNKGKIGAIELAFLQVVNQSLLEKTCKNIPLERIDILKKDEDKMIQFWGYYFSFQHYKDNNNDLDAAKVQQTLQDYKKLMPGSIWKSLQID